MTFKQHWFRFWLRAAYFLRLRWPAIWLVRWLKGELSAPRKELPPFKTPDEIIRYAAERFQYREDKGRVGGWVFPLDWVTDPEVFQARLDDRVQRDGDCDDYHFWVAEALSGVDGIDRLYLMTCGYRGGAHTTVVFRDSWKKWRLVDYALTTLEDPNDAPGLVARRYSIDGTGHVTYYVFETLFFPPWRAEAIGPDKITP